MAERFRPGSRQWHEDMLRDALKLVRELEARTPVDEVALEKARAQASFYERQLQNW